MEEVLFPDVGELARFLGDLGEDGLCCLREISRAGVVLGEDVGATRDEGVYLNEFVRISRCILV